MNRSHTITLVLCAVLATPVATRATAGGFDCSLSFDCRIDGAFSSVKWKPSSSCDKPSAPLMMFVNSLREYNDAVDAFNRFLSATNAYIACITSEAKRDIDTTADVIVKGAKAAQSEAADELRQQRTRLQMLRP